jgi:PKD repeat protein
MTCTLDPANHGASATLSGGNLTVSTTAGAGAVSTLGRDAADADGFRFEVTINSSSDGLMSALIGIANGSWDTSNNPSIYPGHMIGGDLNSWACSTNVESYYASMHNNDLGDTGTLNNLAIGLYGSALIGRTLGFLLKAGKFYVISTDRTDAGGAHDGQVSAYQLFHGLTGTMYAAIGSTAASTRTMGFTFNFGETPFVGTLPAWLSASTARPWGILAPVADFTSVPAAPATAVSPAIVEFTSTSTGGAVVTYLWNFGDGDTSDQANPVHGFHDAGTYDVSLTVTNAGGTSTKTVTSFIVVTDPPVSGSDDRHPRIGYRCIALDNADAVITSDSIATGYAAANLFDWKPYTYWKPATGGEHYVQIVIPEAEVADYIAIAQHNLGENAGTFRLSYSNDGGSSWSDATADYSPSGRESIWLDFDAISARYWRVYTNSVTASVLGVVAFGRKYRPRYGQFAGFMPPKLARSFELYASTSEAGLFLGRTILRKKLKGSIAFDLMEISDAYGDWHPFMQAAEQHPFFLAWLLEDWPEDVQLVETSGDWKPPAITQFGFIGTSIAWTGLLQE